MKFAGLALFALLAATPSLHVLGNSAVAQTPSDCQTQITNLRAATSTASFTGKSAAKDLAGLTAKLDAASAELTAGKNADALGKLTDFRDKVQQLATAGKLEADDAATLTTQVDSAIACVTALGAG